MGKNTKVLVLVEAAIFAAIAMVLSFLPLDIGFSLWVSLGAIPITIISLRRGLEAGLLAGLIWGLLHFVTGKAYVLTPIQGAIEYLIAYAFGGVSGIYLQRYRQQVSGRVTTIMLACLVGTFSRYFWHFVAGVFFWGSYAPEGWSPVVYSLAVNGGSALVTTLLSCVALYFIYQAAPTVFFDPRSMREI